MKIDDAQLSSTNTDKSTLVGRIRTIEIDNDLVIGETVRIGTNSSAIPVNVTISYKVDDKVKVLTASSISFIPSTGILELTFPAVIDTVNKYTLNLLL